MRRLALLLLLPFAARAQEVRPAEPVDASPTATPETTESAEPDTEFFPLQARKFALQGNEEFAAGDYPAAERSYRKVLDLAPGNVLGKVNLGTVLYRQGQFEEAEKVLQEAIQRQMATPSAWMTLGFMYLEEDRLEEATAAFAQAVVFDPSNPRIRNYYGVTIGRRGWLSGAEDQLRRAVEIDPAYGEAHFNLAVFYLERNPPAVELARRHYQKALDLGAAKDPMIDQVLKRGEGIDD